MDVYEVLHRIASAIFLPVITGVAANWLYYHPPHLKRCIQNVLERGRVPKGVTIEQRPTPPRPRRRRRWFFSSAPFLVGSLLGGIVTALGMYSGAYKVTLTQPIEGEHVTTTFDVRGRAGRTSEDSMIFVVLHSLSSPHAPWIISDETVLSPNGWWVGVGKVPEQASDGERFLVYAFRSSGDAHYQPGQAFGSAPMPERIGGRSDAVIVEFVAK